uniref:M96 mating-specific protein family n=1 Tax=Globisporangium ultimum (strain ATCC 200006 / CBS 805.95 / DAOM BR144) TaxID=431595 RepID=K3W8X5_GLOUD
MATALAQSSSSDATDDDPEALHAVLAFVDAALDSPSSPESSDHPSETLSMDFDVFMAPHPQVPPVTRSTSAAESSTSKMLRRQHRQLIAGGAKVRKPPVKPVNPNTNKARDEKKEELIYLRWKVSELEAQLRAIKDERQDEDATQSLLEKLQEKRRQRAAGGACVWQEIAALEYDKLMRSERENFSLKLVLENQLKVARKLEKFLTKTALTREIEKCDQGTKHHIHHIHPPLPEDSDATIFAELLAGVKRSYSEASAVFEASALAKTEMTSPIDAQMRTDRDGNAMFIEVFVNKLLPFDLHATGAAVWNHYVFAKDRLPNRFYNHSTRHNMDATNDTIVESFTLVIELNRKCSHYNVKQILRRYIEAERIVIVWHALFDQTQMDEEQLSGVKFLEKGYLVLKRPQLHAPSINEAYTLLQTCYIETPVLTKDVPNLDSLKVGTITDFALNAMVMNITASHQMIDNVLLEQTMKR